MSQRLHTTTEKWVLDEPVEGAGYAGRYLLSSYERTTYHAEGSETWSFFGRPLTKNGKLTGGTDRRFLPDAEKDRLVALLRPVASSEVSP